MNGKTNFGSRLSVALRLTLGLTGGVLLAALGRGEPGLPEPPKTRTRTAGDAASRRKSLDNTVVYASPDRRAKDGNAIGANGGSTVSWPAHLRDPDRFLYFSIARRAAAARRSMNDFQCATTTHPNQPRAPPVFTRRGTYFAPACVVA